VVLDRKALLMSSASMTSGEMTSGEMTSREACVARDLVDPLRAFRDRFVIPEGVIYLDAASRGKHPEPYDRTRVGPGSHQELE
jgi:hypothetical protein